jgi:sugar lactone lactonase YvrE
MSEAAIITATHALSVGATLGEGPIWIDDALWFVDIKQHHIHRFDPSSGETDRWDAPEMVGWIVPAKDGGFIVGLQSGPHRFDPQNGAFERLAQVDAHLPANRLNDATVDDSGRIWFGTMDNQETDLSGRLYRWDGAALLDTGVTPVCITNGPAIAPGDGLLYHVDTLGQRVIAHDIADDGTLSGARDFLTFGADDGHPDGAICDADGGVWLGFYGGWEARRYASDGTLTDRVRFPVANITKIALGGPDRRTAFATTARQGLDAAALAAQPLAGDLFTFRVAVPGKPLARAN